MKTCVKLAARRWDGPPPVRFVHTAKSSGEVSLQDTTYDRARWALRQATLALEQGSLGKINTLLGYAERWASADVRVILRIAATRLAKRDNTAADLFESLAREHNLREAWVGLAESHVRAASYSLAAQALHGALSQHGPLRNAHFAGFCDRVATYAQAKGWCSLTGGGLLSVAIIETATPRDRLQVRCDDVPVALRRLPKTSTSSNFAAELPTKWRACNRIDVVLDRVHLLGSPISIQPIARVEGFVSANMGALTGWAWLPGDPDQNPQICFRVAGTDVGIETIEATEVDEKIVHPRPLARLRRFKTLNTRLSAEQSKVDVLDIDGHHLYGSPLDPNAEVRSALGATRLVSHLFPAGPIKKPQPFPISEPAVRAECVGPSPTNHPTRREIDVVIPVYRGEAETLMCINSVLSTITGTARVVVVDDASPEASLSKALADLAKQNKILLVTNRKNLGFPSSVNAGIDLAKERDIVLLNSDTIVAGKWLARLQAISMSAPDIGTVTPFSNCGTIVSYPYPNELNEVPTLGELQDITRHAWRANGLSSVDIPTAVGFCMYIRRDCLNEVGLFRTDVFAQGYGEENDFCMRARHLGWRHVCAPGVFVAHKGGGSFGGAKQHLMTRNLRIVNRLHPGYDELIADFTAADPLAPARRKLDRARWKCANESGDTVVLVTHNRTGGSRRRVLDRCAEIRSAGGQPIVLRPSISPAGKKLCVAGSEDENEFPNLAFEIPNELKSLAAMLKTNKVVKVEIHHFIGHAPEMLSLPDLLGVRSEVVVHDYSWFCPRVTLMGADNLYCGEPAIDVCNACVADAGTNIDEEITPIDLRDRSQHILTRASRVTVPSYDTAKRLRRQFPSLPQVELRAWEVEDSLGKVLLREALNESSMRVGLLGAIGPEKGFDYLLACARDAARRRLPIEYVVVGYTSGDRRLINTGVVTITGPYGQEEAVALLQAQAVDIGFICSPIPETWSYTLTEMWRAGLSVLAFDIGAQAERIRRVGRGHLIPLHLSPSRTNDLLLRFSKHPRLRASAATA